MNYNTSDTSEMNSIGFFELNDTDNEVSNTSPLSLNSNNKNTLVGGNNYSATSASFNQLGSNNYSATSAPFNQLGSNNYSATSKQSGGFWPFGSNNSKLLYVALLEKNPYAAIFLIKHLHDISYKKN